VIQMSPKRSRVGGSRSNKRDRAPMAAERRWLSP
jgi:hypothetical protein